MIGIEGVFVGWHQKLLASLIIICGGLALIYAIRQLRNSLSGRYGAITLDVIFSVIITAVLVGAGMVVVEIWGMTSVLTNELQLLRIDDRLPEVVITAVVLIAIYVFSRIARRLLDDLADDSQSITEHQREVGIRLSQLSFWGVGLIIILGIWDVDLTGILVGAGFLGIVIGLAARKTIGSLIAGLVLMFSRPFEVGDWVVVDDLEGIVSDITLMSTRVRAFNGERIVVPNDVVTGEIVINRSREGRLRVEVDVGIDYDDDVDTAVEVAERVAMDVAESHGGAAEQPQPRVKVDSFGDSSIKLRVRVWIEPPTPSKRRDVHHKLIEELKRAFEEHGVQIPYPQRELSSREGAVIGQPMDARHATSE